MPLNTKQLEVLMKPLNPARVKTRSQGGTSLSYLEAWDIKAMLIRVFGIGGFSANVMNAQIVDVERSDDGKIKVAAMVTVQLHIPSLDCTYTETSVAGQTGRTFGDVADFAIKTAESDALKRAAVYLGTQFGLGLYNNGSTGEVVQVILADDQAWNGKQPIDETKVAELGESIGLVPPTGDDDAA